MNRSVPLATAFRTGRGLGALFTLALSLGATTVVQAQAPLTLAEALSAAREKSDEARVIAEKSAKLDAMKRELWAGALPQVTGYARAGRGVQPVDPSVFGSPSDTILNPVVNSFAYGVEANQPIYSFGRLGQSFRTASKQIGAQDEQNRSDLQKLELQALDAFYRVVTAEARVRVLQTSLERQRRNTGFLESNFKSGAGARSTVLLARSALKGLEPELIRAERDADAARMALNRLIGRPVGSMLVVDTTSLVDLSTPSADTSASGLNRTLDQRPDLNALRLQKETMKGYATAYRMQYLPSLGASGKVGILAYQWNEQLTDFDKNLEWSVGVGLTWPLFDGLTKSSKARQYDSDARSLAAAERQARAFATIEIEGAAREVAASDTAWNAAVEAREAAAEAADMIGRDFRAGAGNITDLLSAEEGLRNAELGLLAARYQKTRARASLRLALGMELTKEISK
jgi:outer membrane protein TolC